MSRFSESPPSRELYEAPPPRGRRHADANGGHDSRWIGRSRSGQRGNVRGRGSAYNIPERSRSRSLDGEPPSEPLKQQQGRHRRRRTEPQEPLPESFDDELDSAPPPPRPRGDRQRGERAPAPRARRHEDESIDDIQQGKDRGRDQGRDRKRSGRDRDRDYSRKMMEAQQAQMKQMMSMGMMNPAAMHQMAMMQQMQMGMVHPAYMQAMQQQQMMMSGKRSAVKKDGGSSSGDDSDSSSGSSDNGVPNPAAAMAAMAAMQAQWPASASAGGPPQANPGMPPLPPPPPGAPGMPPLPPPPPGAPGFQAGGGNADNSENATKDNTGGSENAPAGDLEKFGNKEPARRSAKKEIENMVSEYRLSPGCAWMMRALPPDKQKLAAKIDPSGQTDPSGYVAEELKKIV